MKIINHENIVEVIFDESLINEVDQVQQAKKLKKKLEEIYKSSDDRQFGILLDLTKPKIAILSSIGAVRVYEDILKMRQTSKIAVLGKQNFAGKIINIILKNSSENKASWFVLREEAMIWLSI